MMNISKKQLYIGLFVFIIATAAALLGVFSDKSAPGIDRISWNETQILFDNGEVLLESTDIPERIQVSTTSEFGISGPFTGAVLSPDKEWITFTINGAAHGSGWLYNTKTAMMFPVAFQYGGGVDIIEWSPDSQFVAFMIGTPAPTEYISVVNRDEISSFPSKIGKHLQLDEEADLTPPFSYKFIEWQAPHTICFALNESSNCLNVGE